MSNEDLLKPRYKVIADYPGNLQPIGHIYEIIFNDEEALKNWCDNKDYYPHLFKKLEWWEEREEKDMPEYVKGGNEITKLNRVDFESSSEWIFYLDDSHIPYSCHAWFPATKEEYENQQSKINKP